VLLSGVLLLVACTGDEVHRGVQRAELRAVEGCDDLEDMLRRSAIDQMRTQVMANYSYSLDGCRDYDDDSMWVSGDEDGSRADPSAEDSAGSSESEGAEEYSTTNTQEAGVDEADFVKNDGGYVYLVAGNELIIIDAWPAPMAEIISRVTITGVPRLLYVYADHAVVYSDVIEEGAASESDCWGDCGYRPAGNLLISVFDIADRVHPRLEREIGIGGVYVNSRRINDNVHTVMTYPEIGFPEVAYWPEGIDRCGSYDRMVLWRAFSDLIARNEEIINATPISDWVPSLSDTRYAADGSSETDTDLLGSCEGFYEAVGSSGRAFLSVMSFDLTEDGPVNVSSIVGDQGVVYASQDALYVASRHSAGTGEWFFDGAEGVREATAVHRFVFDLEEPATVYDASGVVVGHVLNQFSMSEHRGFFRIATTHGHVPDPDCFNSVFVMQSREGVLEVVGAVTGIAPSEDIRSARFMGDRGFIVTFKKTDPLFALDLSDPAAPSVEGELHIPGFSTYMHPMGEDHLLTIGFDAQDEGDFAWFQGVQLQIFDIGDMSDPRRTHLELIGTRGTTSEATGNHMAFNYFAPHDLLAIPMAICDGGHDGTYGDVMTFNGLLVYNVTIEDGFSEHGRVSHAASDEIEGSTCSSWWSSPNSAVKRSIIMDDFIFSIATDEIIVANLDDLSSPVASIDLPTLPDDGDTYGY
jgi:hypothetical protein